MARKRTINPDIWNSLKFVSLPNGAKLVFIGLISQADDYGRVRADAPWVKLVILPGGSESVEEVEGWLQDIFSAGDEDDRLATPYWVKKSRHAFLPAFEKEQSFGRKFPPKYTCPPLEYTPTMSDKEENQLKNKTLQVGSVSINEQAGTGTEPGTDNVRMNHSGLGTGLGTGSVLDSDVPSTSGEREVPTSEGSNGVSLWVRFLKVYQQHIPSDIPTKSLSQEEISELRQDVDILAGEIGEGELLELADEAIRKRQRTSERVRSLKQLIRTFIPRDRREQEKATVTQPKEWEPPSLAE